MLEFDFSVNRWHEILFFFFSQYSLQDSCIAYKWQWTNIEECSISVLTETVVETWRHAFRFFVPVSEYHDSFI